MVNTYKGGKLNSINKNLIRGLFVRKIKDFDEDYRDRMENKSLLERIRGGNYTGEVMKLETHGTFGALEEVWSKCSVDEYPIPTEEK